MPPRTPPKPPRPQQPELKFQAEVLALCEGRDLWPVLVNPSRFTQRAGQNRGFPDLLIVGAGGVLYRELKISLTHGRGLRPAQVTWRDRLKSSGQNWGTWVPGDLLDGRVDRELAEIETPRADADQWSLSMLGIENPAAAAAVRDLVTESDELGDQADDYDDQADELDDELGAFDDDADDTADTKSNAMPWLLVGGVVAAAAAVIKHR